MEIKNYSNVIGAYKAVGSYPSQTGKTSEAGKAKKVTDVAEFSKDSIDIAKEQVAAEVEKDAAADRIQAIKDDLGSYFLPSDVLSKAILGE